MRPHTRTLRQTLHLPPQIQHAGDGGLYAEFIADRSFGGLAYSLGLFHNNAISVVIPSTSFEHEYLPFSPDVEPSEPDPSVTNLTGIQQWRSTAPPEFRCFQDLTNTEQQPLYRCQHLMTEHCC